MLLRRHEPRCNPHARFLRPCSRPARSSRQDRFSARAPQIGAATLLGPLLVNRVLGHAAESPYGGPIKLEGAPKGTSILVLGAGIAGLVGALELRKGSADVASNAFSADVAAVLAADKNLEVLRAPGTIYAYAAFNLRDPILKDVRVRQAIAYANLESHFIRQNFRKEAVQSFNLPSVD